jgi:23S rRNA pseudouridine1911/1915/1917 synthase
MLVEHFRSRKRTPHVVHRIDRDTSGLVVFAKDAGTQQALKAQFIRRGPERVYLAVVLGHPSPPTGTWRDRLAWDRDGLVQRQAHGRDPRGAEAVSAYRVIERLPGAALLEVRLHTGKRNQIRVQAALRGHPLVGERQYGAHSGRGPGPPAPRFARQALHAWRLGFDHPVDGRRLAFEAPLPSDMTALLERLRDRGRPAL